MKNTTVGQHASYVERLSFALILPRFLLIGPLALIGSFGTMIMGVVGLLHYANTPPNPFAAYADVFPGQPSTAIKEYGFICDVWEYKYYHDPSEGHCSLTLSTGAFANVEVNFSGDQIHQISFRLRERNFMVGKLALYLELSELHDYGSILFSWRGNAGFAQTIKQSKHFFMLRDVWHVTLTDTRLMPQ